MERFTAMVNSRRAAAAPAPDGEEAKENGKRRLTAAEEAYLRIQLEEIIVVKNEDVTRLAAAHGATNHLGGASVRAYAPAAAAPAGGSAAATAARGAVSTTVGWIAGSN